MGLDSVEVVMEIEDEFGIQIPDADAERLTTVGGIYVYLCERLKDARSARTVCASLATFYMLRRKLAAVPGFNREAFRPSARLVDVVPARLLNRYVASHNTSGDLRLVGVRWFPFVGCASALVVGLGVFFLSSLLVAGCAAAFIVMLVIAALLDDKDATSATRSSVYARQTVRQWINVIHRVNGLPSGTGWNEAMIWRSLRRIISEQMGISIADVTPEKHLIYDLGMD